MKKTLVLAALVSSAAFAQETPPPPPMPPPTAAAPAPAADAPMEDTGGRVRWGLSANIGWHAPSPALTFGGEGKIGYVFSNLFNAYAVIGGTVGLGFGVNTSVQGASVSLTAISYYYFGAIAELMFGNLFYVGAGPIFASGAYVGASVGADAAGVAEVSNITSAGFKPGVDLRLGLGFGRPKGPPSFRRGGFNLGLDAMMLFHPNSIITTVKADGPNGTAGASVTTNGLTVSVVPMLTLGYESR